MAEDDIKTLFLLYNQSRLTISNYIMYLFIDTETTGTPKNWNAPVTNLKNWPRMVQVAWLLYDKDKSLIEEKDYIIKPEGFTIPAQSTKIHNISHEHAAATGTNLPDVLHKLASTIDKTETIIAHNLKFDEKIIGAEFLRNKIDHGLTRKKRMCTMEEATDFCALPGKYGYKWPRLSELHQQLFDQPYNEMHNAAADIKATARCFWELRKRGIL